MSILTDSIRNYIGLYETNIAFLKSQGFTKRFSTQLTITTGATAIMTGLLLLSLGINTHYLIWLRIALIPFIHTPLLGLIIIQKINTNKQIKKYRDGESNLIKP